MPPPDEDWFEQPFGEVAFDQFALDLRRRAPRPIRAWLDAPLTTRCLADSGPDGFMTGGSLAEWFDVAIHRQPSRRPHRGDPPATQPSTEASGAQPRSHCVREGETG